MSEGTDAGEGQPNGGEGQTVEQLQARLKEQQGIIENQKSTNNRLLDESKDFKNKWNSSQSELDKANTDKLESEGKTSELLTAEREKNGKLTTEIVDLRDSTLRSNLRTEVGKYAKDAHNVDMILKVTEHKSLLNIDESNLSFSGVEDFVNKVRETHDYLFQKGTIAPMENGRPPKEIPQGDLTDANYQKELKLCNTQQAYDACRRKYGRAD